MDSWKKKRVRKSGEIKSDSVFRDGLYEEGRELGVLKVWETILRVGGRVEEGRKFGEKRETRQMGLMLGMRQCIRKIAY